MTAPGDGTEGTINALPERLRRYVHDLETRCDPAGEVRALFFQREELDAARAEIARLREWLQLAEALGQDIVDELRAAEAEIVRLKARFTAPVVVMCGSTRFRSTWSAELTRLTDEGNIVLSVGRMMPQREVDLNPMLKARLDQLHKRKVDLADWVWVLDVGGYIGASTQSEIAYAVSIGRPIRYLSRECPEFIEPPDELVAERAARLAAEEALEGVRLSAAHADEWLVEVEAWLTAQPRGSVVGLSSALHGVEQARAALGRHRGDGEDSPP